jgi:hypothetical protein
MKNGTVHGKQARSLFLHFQFSIFNFQFLRIDRYSILRP